jgi:hypothetical protein
MMIVFGAAIFVELISYNELLWAVMFCKYFSYRESLLFIYFSTFFLTEVIVLMGCDLCCVVEVSRQEDFAGPAGGGTAHVGYVPSNNRK